MVSVFSSFREAIDYAKETAATHNRETELVRYGDIWFVFNITNGSREEDAAYRHAPAESSAQRCS